MPEEREINIDFAICKLVSWSQFSIFKGGALPPSRTAAQNFFCMRHPERMCSAQAKRIFGRRRMMKAYTLMSVNASTTTTSSPTHVAKMRHNAPRQKQPIRNHMDVIRMCPSTRASVFQPAANTFQNKPPFILVHWY